MVFNNVKQWKGEKILLRHGHPFATFVEVSKSELKRYFEKSIFRKLFCILRVVGTITCPIIRRDARL